MVGLPQQKRLGSASLGRGPFCPVLARGPIRLLAVFLFLAGSTAQAQSFKLGPFFFTSTAELEFGLDSNVDDSFPDEQDPDLQPGDFYWMPGLTLRSEPAAVQMRTKANVHASLFFQDYFSRNDMDTELYDIFLGFDTTHPRLTLRGDVGTAFETDAEADKYYPGGAAYDPRQTDTANLSLDWRYRKLLLKSSVGFIREQHQYERFMPDDNEEATFLVGAFLENVHRLSLFSTFDYTDTIYTFTETEEEEVNLNWGADYRLFSWGGLMYTSERAVTRAQPSGERTDETTDTFGLTGTIPFEQLRHPHITYQLGVEHTVVESESGAEEETWAPSHMIRVWDELQITRTVNLMGDLTWDNNVDEDEIGTVYLIRLSQKIGARAQHAVTFTQEPRNTLGSNKDTETTTTAYDFSVRDFLLYNLEISFLASFEEDTPLDEENPITEETTTLGFTAKHARKLSRKLSRLATYTFELEDSNFHEGGPREKHLLTYRLSYEF